MGKEKKILIASNVIASFSNYHGWISYSRFNDWMKNRGFDVIELERHNMTDGQVHFKYVHKDTLQSFEFNGNYWSAKSFSKVVEWLNQNGL